VVLYGFAGVLYGFVAVLYGFAAGILLVELRSVLLLLPTVPVLAAGGAVVQPLGQAAGV